METPDTDQNPPIFKTWNRWYAFILVVLAVQVLLYWLITLKYA